MGSGEWGGKLTYCTYFVGGGGGSLVWVGRVGRVLDIRNVEVLGLLISTAVFLACAISLFGKNEG